MRISDTETLSKVIAVLVGVLMASLMLSMLPSRAIHEMPVYFWQYRHEPYFRMKAHEAIRANWLIIAAFVSCYMGLTLTLATLIRRFSR